jgi:hypothetical protein
MTARLTQADRMDLTRFGEAYRKKSRVLAIQMHEPFVVETDRGLMKGVAGDWLVTNHPDDDPGSDLWSISAERMAATYEPAEDR